MKTPQTIFLATVLLLVAACDKPEHSSKSCFYDDSTSTDLSTRSEGPEADSFYVTDEDLFAYVKYKSLLLKEEITVRSIEPITLESEEPLLYIIRYDEGWDLLAADKRATLPLSSSPSGDLVLDPRNPMTTWIYCLAEDVLITRKSLEKESANPEITDYNISQWKAITADSSLFRDFIEEFFRGGQTRDPIPPEPPFPTFPFIGHYELVDVDSSVVYYDSLPHLIPLSWQQTGVSCNSYVPLKNDGSGDRVPAGCVAVAGAQVLYYLHYHINVPATAPTTAYCNGMIPNYTMGQGDYSSAAWSYMDSLGTHPYVGMLIASVAQKVNMSFGNTGSSAYYSDLYAALPDYSIAADYTFDTVSAYDSLIQISFANDLPVICFAWPSYNSMDGHAFIIDGYRRQAMETRYRYQWVWDYIDPNSPQPRIPDEYVLTYSSPTFTDYYMNWGWDPEYNSLPFSVSGNWKPKSDNQNFFYDKVFFWNFRNYFE